jgi:hypothetical protein
MMHSAAKDSTQLASGSQVACKTVVRETVVLASQDSAMASSSPSSYTCLAAAPRLSATLTTQAAPIRKPRARAHREGLVELTEPWRPTLLTLGVKLDEAVEERLTLLLTSRRPFCDMWRATGRLVRETGRPGERSAAGVERPESAVGGGDDAARGRAIPRRGRCA